MGRHQILVIKIILYQFTMNIGITVVSVILVAVCASPIIYFIVSRKNQEKKIITSIKKLAAQNQETISAYETCGQLIVGVNNNSATLYYAKQLDDRFLIEKLSLKQVAGAVVETKYKNDSPSKLIEHLGIRFLPKNGQVADLYWNFYNIKDNFQLNGELQLAESWVKRINQMVV